MKRSESKNSRELWRNPVDESLYLPDTTQMKIQARGNKSDSSGTFKYGLIEDRALLEWITRSTLKS